MAVFCDHLLALVADDKDAGGGFDDVIGDGLELVDLEHSGDLGKQAFKEPEVAAGDALDRGDGLGIGEVVRVQRAAKPLPVSVEDEQEFIAAERPVVV